MDEKSIHGKEGAERRRSQRVYLKMPVLVRGTALDLSPFREETETVVVNAHGAQIMLAAQVVRGQPLFLTNPKTGEEQECRVASIGPGHTGKVEVGIEFAQLAPKFWRIAFPPPDWTPRSPEARRPSSSQSRTRTG